MRRKYLYKKPYRIKKKKSIFRNRFFWIAILVLIIFGGIFYLVCFSSTFQVKDTEISGNQKIQTQDIENLIKEKINKKLLFFPTKSIFLIDSNEIVRSLSEKFLQADSVILKRRLPATLIVEIQERLPLGVWCQALPSFPSENLGGQAENCFYVDREGIIFEENPSKTEFIIKSQEQRTQAFLGEKVIEKVLLESIFEIQRKLKENLKIDIKEIIILEKEKINAQTSEDWEIYFDPTGDINWQLTKLSLVLEKEIPPERRKDLEYIELRFGNFAPYKYK
ncbi:MAG: cell division protein FtsQ/DivIB [Candidatus Nealsonbacteria bacterium]